MSVPRACSAGEASPHGVSPPAAAWIPGAVWPPRESRQSRVNRARGGKPSRSKIRKVRLTVFPRDDFTCQDCGWKADPPPSCWDGSRTLLGPEPLPPRRRDVIASGYRLLTLGHVIPATEGGVFEPENVRAQCSRCNYGEGNRIRAAHNRGLTLAGEPWTPIGQVAG